MTNTVVDPEVSRRKLRREVADWKANSGHKERGWVLLDFDDQLPAVELAFLAKIAINAGSGFLAAAVCAIRLTYDNYDLVPPSLTFIDMFTRLPANPHVRAFLSTPEGPRDVLIDGHPLTDRPFLCLPGIREYHTHPQHTGDDWLLHRTTKAGNLSTISERIWRLMCRNVVGLSINVQGLPTWPLQAQIAIQLAQGEVADAAAIAGNRPKKP